MAIKDYGKQTIAEKLKDDYRHILPKIDQRNYMIINGMLDAINKKEQDGQLSESHVNNLKNLLKEIHENLNKQSDYDLDKQRMESLFSKIGRFTSANPLLVATGCGIFFLLPAAGAFVVGFFTVGLGTGLSGIFLATGLCPIPAVRRHWYKEYKRIEKQKNYLKSEQKKFDKIIAGSKTNSIEDNGNNIKNS